MAGPTTFVAYDKADAGCVIRRSGDRRGFRDPFETQVASPDAAKALSELKEVSFLQVDRWS